MFGLAEVEARDLRVAGDAVHERWSFARSGGFRSAAATESEQRSRGYRDDNDCSDYQVGPACAEPVT
jgi:hypothetical protein